MEQFLPVSIGFGLAVSLLFSELFGLAAGGMVVPGYLALHLARPLDVTITMAAGVITYLIVHMLSLTIIIFGRRRTVIMILVGYLIGMSLGPTLIPLLQEVVTKATPKLVTYGDMRIIGYIIPGLIAIWIDRQGIVETITASITAAVVVRLLLIMIFGMELPG